MTRAHRLILLLLTALACGGSWPLDRLLAAEWEVDHAMYQDPELKLPPWRVLFSKKLKPLWLQALARPDAEMRRLAADSFSMAIAGGMADVDDIVAPLTNILKTDTDPVVRRAVARTLVVLKSKASAAVLVEASQKDGLLMAQIVEPALAQWQEPLLQETWLQRLNDRNTQLQMQLLAISGLATQDDARAVVPLTELMLDRLRPPELRLAAAKALGEMNETGLTDQAQQLATAAANAENLSHAEFFGRLLAVTLLARHQDADAQKLLETLAADQEPAVAAAALSRLHALQSPAALRLAPTAIASLDARMRRLGAEILITVPTVETVQQLAPLLNDRNPTVRKTVAKQFVEFGKTEALRTAVLEQADKMLASDEWRALEQAALIIGHLDHEPAADRLIALLTHARGEPAVAAAWALRKLEVAATLPALLKQADEMHNQSVGGIPPTYAGAQLTQLFQAFGQLRYREAEPLLRKYVPKSTTLDTEARAAACWALGYLYENNPDPALVAELVARAGDVGIPPEYPVVRRMSAIALGRMKAEGAITQLRAYFKMDGPGVLPGLASGWAIEQLTGETFERKEFLERYSSSWFLEPLE